MSLPSDLSIATLFSHQIVSHLLPADLISLSRCNKSLRNLLMNRSSKHIWTSAMENVEGLPPCPPEMSEPYYARLLFLPDCTICGGSEDCEPYLKLLLRLCVKCRSKHLMTIPLPPRGQDELVFARELDGLVSSVEVFTRSGCVVRISGFTMIKEEANDLRSKFEELHESGDEAALNTWMEERTKAVEQQAHLKTAYSRDQIGEAPVYGLGEISPQIVKVIMNSPTPTMNIWKNAHDLLAATLKSYLNACTSLEIEMGCSSPDTKHLASRIDTTLESLRLMTMQFTQSTAIILRTRNRVASHVTRLPKELLSKIFLDVVYAPEHTNLPMVESLRTMYRNLHNLIEVCSVWRDVATTEGQLWETLPAIDDPIKLDVINLSLTRSRGRALCLAVNLPNGGVAPLLLDIVKENAHRLRALNVTGKDMEDIDQILAETLQACVPSHLSELSVQHLLLDTEQTDMICVWFLDQDDSNKLLNNLSSLRLAGVQVDWETTAFSNRLVEFMLFDVELGYSDVDIYTFLSALSTASELRYLKLMFIRSMRAEDEDKCVTRSKSQVVFPKLQTLGLGYLSFNVMEFFLLAIAPGSYKLALDITPASLKFLRSRQPIQSMTPDDLAELLFPISIDSLSLHRGRSLDDFEPWSEGSGLQRIIRSIPKLKKLALIGWDFDADFCKGLYQGEWTCPELEALKLFWTRVSNEVEFKKLLIRIPSQTMTLGGYLLTKEGPVAFEGGQDMVEWDWLMSRSSRYIWISAMKNIKDLPPCPPDMSEPYYVTLLFLPCCTICGESKGCVLHFRLRLRLCVTCRSEYLLTIRPRPRYSREPGESEWPRELEELAHSVELHARVAYAGDWASLWSKKKPVISV
ncbi:F-box-like protein [Rhizoctonia solani AG-3 Rhs1AP]|uniref:F-box-like protein n=1 Tax=Rhizoctonia solani AG-3 Rhs1AP TaxID=1086054 RepID=X8J4H1_9AGAM|nr:F-box-like protein [Rhizoctonia solani AG-3 Rhs1AP]